jgi:cytidylate kinase
MANIGEMTAYIEHRYGGKWPERVRAMNSWQIVAIYRDMVKRDKLDAEREKNKAAAGEQLCLFEKNNLTIKEEYLSERGDEADR